MRLVYLLLCITLCTTQLSAQLSNAFCPDLVFEEVAYVQTKGKKVTYRIKLKNPGNMRISLGGDDAKSDKDNVGWKAYLSVDDKYNGGDIFVAGGFFESKVLAAAESWDTYVTFKLGDVTSFTKILIFQLDPHEMAKECDETNNFTSIRLKENTDAIGAKK